MVHIDETELVLLQFEAWFVCVLHNPQLSGWDVEFWNQWARDFLTISCLMNLLCFSLSGLSWSFKELL